jgi:carboxyl-terminal processing protease
MLRVQLKALIARDLWQMDAYYAIINEHNDVVLRALELIDGK